jgi:chromosome segregation ATPase
MASPARNDDLDETLVEAVRKLTSAEPEKLAPADAGTEIASLATRLETVEETTRTLSDTLRKLQATIRNLNRSQRHYTPFRH